MVHIPIVSIDWAEFVEADICVCLKKSPAIEICLPIMDTG